MPPKIFFQILDVFLYHMVDAAIAPPVGGRPGQPAAAEVRDGDEGIVVVARGAGGESAASRRRDDDGQGPRVEFGEFGDRRGRRIEQRR